MKIFFAGFFHLTSVIVVFFDAEGLFMPPRYEIKEWAIKQWIIIVNQICQLKTLINEF